MSGGWSSHEAEKSTFPTRGRPRTKNILYQTNPITMPFYNMQDPIFYGSNSQWISPPWNAKELPGGSDAPQKKQKMDSSSLLPFAPDSSTSKKSASFYSNLKSSYAVKTKMSEASLIKTRLFVDELSPAHRKEFIESVEKLDFENVTVNQLKDMLRKFNLNCAGKKACLVGRIKELIRVITGKSDEPASPSSQSSVEDESEDANLLKFEDIMLASDPPSPVESPPELFFLNKF